MRNNIEIYGEVWWVGEMSWGTSIKINSENVKGHKVPLNLMSFNGDADTYEQSRKISKGDIVRASVDIILHDFTKEMKQQRFVIVSIEKIGEKEYSNSNVSQQKQDTYLSTVLPLNEPKYQRTLPDNGDDVPWELDL